MSNGIVNIHGKQYVTVAKRLSKFQKDMVTIDDVSIYTEVLQHEPVVVVRATVEYNKKSFTGISAANPDKAMEKSNPYEVAETSAVGRALAFAGYESELGIASAEEMIKAGVDKEEDPGPTPPEDTASEIAEVCPKCGSELVSMITRNGKHAIKCSTNVWNRDTMQAEGCDYIIWKTMTQDDL